MLGERVTLLSLCGRHQKESIAVRLIYKIINHVRFIRLMHWVT